MQERALQYAEMSRGSRIVEVSDNLHLATVLITEFPGTNAFYRQGSVTIEILPNDILVEIFSFYVEEISEPWEARGFERIHAWITLVHVSQRWRNLAFTSSRKPQSANSLHKQKTREGDAGCLANLAFSHMVPGNW